MTPYQAKHYAYRVVWSEKDRAHVGLCTEFSALSHRATSPQEALDGVVALVAAALPTLKEPPPPISLRTFNGKIAVRVPPQRHRELAKEAAAQGISMNRLINQKLCG